MNPTPEGFGDLPSLATAVPADSIELLQTMLRIRAFEDTVKVIFERGLMRGSTHLYNGQEAIATGVCSALSPLDTMTCTYRGHGAVIAMGAPIDRCLAEILGRGKGICGGKGGSMHLTDVSVGALGSNAIVGGHLPIALGAAFAADYLGTGAVTVAFFGDGAANIGAFHESLNMAAIWKLPVIFVLENNKYGEYSAQAVTTPIARLADRAASYGMPGVQVDGNDVVSMREATLRAASRARQGEGPTLIEADTYRHQGHSRSDQAKYRPIGELEEWLSRDPIDALEKACVREGLLDEAALERIHSSVEAELSAALERAMSWAPPEVSELTQDVFA